MKRLLAGALALTAIFAQAEPLTVKDGEGRVQVLRAGDASLAHWRLPDVAPAPADNATTPARVALGKMLFVDPRLSGTGQVTCLSCHLPERGWSDGFPTSVRFLGTVMKRASPTLINVGFNSIFMWDGRQPTLEKQAHGGQGMQGDINAGMDEFGVSEGAHIARIAAIPGYVKAFAAAYPGEGISRETIAKAIAAFERTLISNRSPFDRWLAGDTAALSPAQIRGFAVFLAPDKGNCAVCHAPPNFTDNGFHNVGLKSGAAPDADPGRYAQRKVAAMKGAFKTPTLRDITLSAPYFHDGSARSLREVIEHYVRGGDVRDNLSPEVRKLDLGEAEKQDLLAFMQALSSDHPPFDYPVLPR